jgi:hypothetical protein
MNGILVDSLRRHRPFSPSFIGRAEDQVYLFSTFAERESQLTCAHKDGLAMRHDKESFAKEAMKAAHIGKLVGDYVRIVHFSTYARVLSDDIAKVKDMVDPFTGCFISRIPSTVACLRFAFRAASFFADGKRDEGLNFIRIGARRLAAAFEFVQGEYSLLEQQYEKERTGWHLYYETLSAVEKALKEADSVSQELRRKAQLIIQRCCLLR